MTGGFTWEGIFAQAGGERLHFRTSGWHSGVHLLTELGLWVLFGCKVGSEEGKGKDEVSESALPVV